MAFWQFFALQCWTDVLGLWRLPSEVWSLAVAQRHRYLDLLNTFSLRSTHCSVSITIWPASAHLHIKEDVIVQIIFLWQHSASHLGIVPSLFSLARLPYSLRLTLVGLIASMYHLFFFLWHNLIITRTSACHGRHPFKCASEFHELCDIHIKIQVHTRSHQKKQSWSGLLYLWHS